MSLERRVLSWLTREVPRDLLYRPPADAGALAVGEVVFRWLGAAGFEVRAADGAVLIDPYFTRPGLVDSLFRPLVPDEQLIASSVRDADGIFAGHSHHDHAMDVGPAARHSGATVFGSESALHLARLGGATEQQLHHIAAGDRFCCGPFSGQVLRSVHGKVAAGRIPLPGRIGDPPGPLKLRQYRVGASFGLAFEVAGVRFFHLGSADFVESAFDGVECDVLLLCIVGRQGTPRFTQRILERLQPKVVLPCHWDLFLLPTTDPARVIPGVRMHDFFEEVAQAAPSTEVVLLDFFGEYRFRLS